ncbi:MAG: hypothetical protein CVV21_04945 [Candidatus Goldiibacteriota bacterium HGW-Goldbacteria-1]|jgi:opacity protein-like surface antigen|nr:MAG: hypothetical protein CVV21_04945 [Candidatus Goldiibacteriota bacterium HGW-Goldbacteria-1]
MKKFLAAAMIVCVFALPAIAEDAVNNEDKPYKTINVGLDIDYTMPAMNQLNAQLNDGGSNVREMNAGIAMMLNVDAAMAPFIMVGLRGGYIYCLPAGADYLFETVKQTINAGLIPVEIGVITNFSMASTPISIMAGIYGGYGFALASYETKYDILGVTAESVQPFDGAGFVGELMGKVNYEMVSGINVNINAGYRLAKIMQLKQSKDVSYTDSLGISHSAGEKGDVLKDSDNTDMAYDFSGFNIGVGVSLGF